MTLATDHTVKVTLEGEPLFVKATVQRLEEFFTVTYKSKYQHIHHRNDRVRRYLRLLPPALAHGEGAGGQGSGASEKPARESEDQ